MKTDVVTNLLHVNNNLIIPSYIIKYYSDLDLEGFTLIFMIYLINQKGEIVFDINKIANDLNQESSKILDIINELNEKNYISIEMKKVNGVIEEYISIELFFNKISSYIIEEKNDKKDNNIFSLFEQEFGRTLSPIECEAIDNWLKNGISEELIKSALKEAILSGVHNFRYVDKILFDWNKKGYKTESDVKNRKSTTDDYVEEIYDYDWINDD